MYDTSDFRKNLKIEYNGAPYVIVDFLHVNPGKGSAFVRTKIKNMQTGQVLDITFKSGEKVGRPDLEEHVMQYLYFDGNYHFMNQTTYEQIELDEETVGEAKWFFVDSETVDMLFYQGRPVSIDLPNFVNLEVTETGPNLKGDTASGSGSGKPATLSTGLVVTVPFHINMGDILKIDTRTSKYVERVKTGK